MEFKEWFEKEYVNEGFSKWAKKLAFPLIATAGINQAKAQDPFQINIPSNPPEINQPVKNDFGITKSPWEKDFEFINKMSGNKPFPYDSSKNALNNIRKQAVKDPDFLKNITTIVNYMHGLEFRESIGKLSGFKNIPNDISTRELFQKMWGQYKRPELELTKDPFYKSYSNNKNGKRSVRIGTEMSGEIPSNPYFGTGHEYIHQTQGEISDDNKELCELPTCLSEGIWMLMAAEKQAQEEHRKSPFQGKSIQLPNGKILYLDFLINQAKKFNAFENPAKLTELLASPIGMAWLKNITAN